VLPERACCPAGSVARPARPAAQEKLIHGFKQGIIDRAWAKHQELVKQKNKTIEAQSIEDFVRKDEG
jgi:hypothetical protein